ncbi:MULTISPECIES: NAD(P)/FAD-dependent oxidoreductase [Kosmotoga]|uniref:FAD dependent oxidoreductase n=1 Tax=Kosmotoga olearia (strain ATCC BAA-1733 / DSM 21960 / TBF 19.5.1) TaxID=521045 RepID=C5CID7_KOSOT|nr:MULTISPECIES: FAD-dependent monooxygenase [Kosmotoga]ACR78871.1 FAD dependent oxidoreductase [Kosmotoga olearia TBF 19.5.1]OAA24853.1 hypothetical protein DU53_00605 [Kosmotoga sp. DU53]
MEKKAEVIIIGAGPAGSTAATVLARRNFDILLIDKCQFPRDKVCGGVLTAKSMKLLEKIHPGVVFSLNLKPITKVSFGYPGTERKNESITYIYKKPLFYVATRKELDNALMENALRNGAKYENDAIIRIERLDDGFICHGRSGNTYSAPYVVIAAGVFGHNLLENTSKISYSIAYKAQTASVPITTATINFHDFGYTWILPGKGFFNVGIGSYDNSLTYADAENIVKKLFNFPIGKLNAAPLPMFDKTISVDLNNMVPGCLFVGDSGGFVDPWTGEGISFAMETGFCSAKAIIEKGGDRLKVNDDFLGRIRRIGIHLQIAGILREKLTTTLPERFDLLSDIRMAKLLYVYLNGYLKGIDRLMIKGFFFQGVKGIETR